MYHVEKNPTRFEIKKTKTNKNKQPSLILQNQGKYFISYNVDTNILFWSSEFNLDEKKNCKGEC